MAASSRAQFTELRVLATNVSADHAAWGDFDADGDLDVLASASTNYFGNQYPFAQVYRNDGSNVFSPGALLLNAFYVAPAWGDFDKDGDLDAFVTGYYWTGYIGEVHRNDGGGAFTKVATLPGVSDGAALWADLDNDGDLDLLFGGLQGAGQPDVTWIYRNDGNGTFTDSRSSLPGAGFYCNYRTGDLDRDGDLDLLIAGNGRAFVLRNDGHLTFVIVMELPGVLYGTGDIGDFDNDGWLDILLAGEPTSYSGVNDEFSRVYRNTGGFSFSNITAALRPLDHATGTFGDWDADGDLDVMLGGTSWAHQFDGYTRLYGNSNGVFTVSITNLPPLVTSHPTRAGDYDNDGDLDVLLPGHVFRNESPSNTPPTAPTGLTATVLTNHDLLLSWSGATDAQTPVGGLSYNLRVGTTPGGSEVMSAQSRPSDGKLLLAQRGIATDAGWRLRNLRHGTHYWSVQAVDSGFAASSFAAEGTFTITNSPPRISLIADQSAFPGQSPAPIMFQVEDDESPVTALMASAQSANTNVVRNEDLIVSGTGMNRTLTLTPRLGAHGSTRITVTVTDADARTAVSQFTFAIEEFTKLANASSRGDVAWGDYDNDGWLDIIFAEGGNLPLVRNVDGATFANTSLYFWNYPWYSDARWTDYNSDGFLDVFFRGYVYRSVGGTSMTNVATGLPVLRNSGEAWGDFDSDGDADLAISGEDINYLTTGGIYRNLGGDKFANMAFIIGGAGTLAPADYDNDGDVDLLASGFPLGIGRACRLYRNDLGTFTQIPLTFSNLNAHSASWGDYDNDGDVDLIISGEYFNGPSVTPPTVTRIYRNDGNSILTDLGVNLPSGYATTAWLDYDNDGWLDAFVGLTASRTNIYRIYRNLHDSTFADIDANLTGVTAFADFDNDGDLDGGPFFRNNAAVPNTPPNAPQSASATTVLTSVRFSWAPATDANQSGGHSYNLRVGRLPGTADVMTPMSDLITGQRRVAERGNAGQITSWFLTNLAVGTYYWSVQAIDHSLAGSAWTPEQSFVIPQQPPIVITHTATNETFNGALLRGEMKANGFASAWRFEYGAGTNLTSATPWVDAGNGTNLISVSATVSDLELATAYSFRLTATNVNGFMSGATHLLVTRTFTNIVLGSAFDAARAAWGDFDNDGDLDLARMGAAGSAVLENLGSDQFQVRATNLPAGSGSIRWGDFDNDGFLDLFLSGLSSASRTARIYRNNGDRTFTDLLVPLGAGVDGAMGDFNNDGKLDLVVLNTSSCVIYRNLGNGMFTAVQTIDGAGSAAFGDYNGDGFLDLLTTGNTQYQYNYLYRNSGNGTFSLVTSLGLPAIYGGSVDWGDFDNDGWLDFAVNGTQNGTEALAQTTIYRNMGGSVFAAVGANLPRSYFGTVHWGDYNSDGRLDLLATGQFFAAGSGARVFRGDGAGTFLDVNVGISVYRALAGWADDDNDGDLDYYAVSPGQIHRNLGHFANTPPVAPGNLSATVGASNDVLFTWASASDPETSDARGLSYSLRIGTTAGGADVLAAPADLLTGFRRLPQMGSVKSNAWILRGAPRGTYYWSVQAVDGGFAGSPFAGEATFSITNDRPAISPIPDTAVAPGQTPTTIPFTVVDDNTPANDLLLTVRSSNTSFVANANAVIDGTGTNRTLTLSTGTNINGATFITLTATDASGLVATHSFRFAVETFTSVSNGLPAANRMSGSWGDYDNDGDLDLAYSFETYQGSGLKVFRNDSSVFTDIEFGFIPNSRGAVQWLDVNNDGWLDLFVFGGTNAGTYLNQSDGTFTHQPDFALPGSGSYKIVAGDFDNDGRADLLISGTSMQPRVLFNRDGVLTSGALLPFGSSALAAADLDGDGDLDVISSGQSGERVSWNDGAGNFPTGVGGFTAVSSGCATAGDFDGDGDMDVALSGEMAALFLYRNNSDGTFSLVSSNLPGVGNAWGTLEALMAAADFDNDGRTDLLLSGCAGYCSGDQSYSLRVLRNSGDWNFETILTSYNSSLGAVCGDVDGDGDLDIVRGGPNGLLRNNLNSLHPLPPAPISLMSTVVSDGIILSWVPPTNSATYALRIGTAQGGFDVMSSHSDPLTGKRRVAAPGHALQQWKFRAPLPIGDYYWSVQTIDNGWAGSAFAPEQMFSISNHPPDAQWDWVSIFEDSPRWIWLYMSDFNGQSLTPAIVSPPTNGTVTLDPPWAIYQPHTNFFGWDSFTFQAHDGITNSAPARVSIEVYNVPDASEARVAATLSSNRLELILRGEPYQHYQVEASENLTTWTPSPPIQLSANGTATFVETADGFAKRFFRLRVAP